MYSFKPLLILFLAIFTSTPTLASQSVDTAQCAAENCWKNTFETIAQTAQNLLLIVKEAQARFQEKLDEVTNSDIENATKDEMKIALFEATLAECEDLRDGPSKPRHLILIGHHFRGDGENFRLAGFSRYKELVHELCGDLPSDPIALDIYTRCKRGVIIKDDVSKVDLIRYLRFLRAESLQSVDVFSHASSNALTTGARDLLIPVDWDPSLKISYDQWRRINSGRIYAADLTDDLVEDKNIGKLLSSALANNAPVSLFGCHTAEEIGAQMQAVAGHAQVKGCKSGAHFEFQKKKDGQWIVDWQHPVPKDAYRVRMRPDGGEFIKVEAKKAEESKEDELPSEEAPEDRAVKGIVLRLAINAGDRAKVDQGRRTVIFTQEDRDEIREIMGDKIRRLSWTDASLTRNQIVEKFEIAAASSDDQRRRERITRVVDKIKAAEAEALRLYYK